MAASATRVLVPPISATTASLSKGSAMILPFQRSCQRVVRGFGRAFKAVEIHVNEAEALFMEFYKKMTAGLTLWAALQKAKLTRLAIDPEGDWSKFVLLGE